jgi:hypothetical protein
VRAALLFALLGCAAEPGPELAAAAAPFQQALRPDNPSSNDLFRFEPGDSVESFDGDMFRVHFTRAGTNAVPGADANTNGVPDFVEQVAATYDEVLAYFTNTLGFLAPLSDELIGDNGGDTRFDVYLVDFALQADGAFRIDGCLGGEPERCVGYMVQENDFAGYGYPSATVAIRTLASHELFHAVQAAYDAGQSTVVSEGTAVWASESYAPELADFEGFVDGYLDLPDRSLDTPLPGPVDPYSYGAALFFQFLAERHAPIIVRELWERCVDGAFGLDDPEWFEVLNPLLATYDSTFAEEFVEHARWNLYTGARADAGESYARGSGYPSVAMETVTLPYQSAALRLFYASTQYVVGAVSGRTRVSAELVGDDLAGVRLLLATRDADGYYDVVEAAPGTDLAVGAATQVVAAVINTNQSGASKRPALCLGSPDEVRACVAALRPAAPAPSGEPDDGCTAAAAQPLLALLFLLRRRRARGASRLGAAAQSSSSAAAGGAGASGSGMPSACRTARGGSTIP